MIKSHYSISHIRDIRSLIEIRYLDGREEVLELREIKNLKERIDFEREFRPTFEVIRIHKFPHSKRVNILNKKSGVVKILFIKEDTSTEFYDLLEKFSFGAYINGRETKFKNVFLVYEALEKSPEYKFVAVRHAISHPKLTKDKTIITLKSLFGTERIDLKKRKHNLIFRNIYFELENKVHELLVHEIGNMLKGSKQSIGAYNIV